MSSNISWNGNIEQPPSRAHTSKADYTAYVVARNAAMLQDYTNGMSNTNIAKKYHLTRETVILQMCFYADETAIRLGLHDSQHWQIYRYIKGEGRVAQLRNSVSKIKAYLAKGGTL